MGPPNSDYLLTLIQGEEGREWAATKNGWKNRNEDGEFILGHFPLLSKVRHTHHKIID